ncbi:MAG: hypothetical protein ACI37Z_05035 [Candidatus Gastranaerophilaceae bacterium]
MNSDIEINDIVRVIDSGETYDNYEQWINDICPEELVNWNAGYLPSEIYEEDNDIELNKFVVIAKAPHSRGGKDILYLIKSIFYGWDYIVAEPGLEKI